VSDPDTQRRESLERWDQVAAAWAKHADWMLKMTRPLSQWLVDALELRPGQTVLELAAGPGDTGFLAAALVQPGGRLISSDNSQAMLEIARARGLGLGLTDVEHRLINAESIDLPVASVDAVLCRWGLMLFVDPAAALGEMRRVLKPGGRVALAVWGSPHSNLWLSVPDEVIFRHGLVPVPEEGAPGPFALADPERLRGLIEGAGFVELELDSVEVEPSGGSFAEWWERQLDLRQSGTAVRAAPEELQCAVADEVRAGVTDFRGLCLVAVAS
jgi:ubiquinone/menaquinone biosynthesis C-methylase UbiE